MADYFTLAEIAERLQFSERKLRQIIRQRGIPVLEAGRDIRFDTHALIALEEALRRPIRIYRRKGSPYYQIDVTVEGQRVRRSSQTAIIKKTKARIYFSEDERFPSSDPDLQYIYFIDRAPLECGEKPWHRGIRNRLSLTPPGPEETEALPDLRQLKAEMANAHPDHGGSEVAFIEARERYLAAKRRHSQVA